jgi:hypothetical protein
MRLARLAIATRGLEHVAVLSLRVVSASAGRAHHGSAAEGHRAGGIDQPDRSVGAARGRTTEPRTRQRWSEVGHVDVTDAGVLEQEPIRQRREFRGAALFYATLERVACADRDRVDIPLAAAIRLR